VLVERTLGERRPLVRQARPAGLSVAGLRKRFRRALGWHITHAPGPVVPPGELVLLGDGIWFRFAKKLWTLYTMAVKPIGANSATFLDPILLPGMECLTGWRVAVDTIPTEVRTRICAFVSDGFRGSARLARTYGWIHQRCHFHLIAQLQGRRGRYKHLATTHVREAIYVGIRQALVTHDGAHLARLRTRLASLAQRDDCPKRFRMFVRDFLRELDTFRAYQRYPHLHLPTTTNVVEAMAKVIRDQLRPLSTPRSLQQWATALIRLRPTMVCNGHQDQPN